MKVTLIALMLALGLTTSVFANEETHPGNTAPTTEAAPAPEAGTTEVKEHHTKKVTKKAKKAKKGAEHPAGGEAAPAGN